MPYQRRDNVYTAVLNMNGISVGYVHLHHMTSHTLPAAAEDAETLRRFFAEINDLSALIIDIRGNGGGDDGFWLLILVGPLLAKPVSAKRIQVERTGEYSEKVKRHDAGATIAQHLRIGGSSTVLKRSELASLLSQEELANLSPEVLTPDFTDIVINSNLAVAPGGYGEIEPIERASGKPEQPAAA